MISGIVRRVQHALHFCATTTAPNDSGPVQTTQMAPDDLRTFDNTPVIQHFGLSSCLPIGSMVARISGLGDTTSGIGIGSVHQPSRPRGLTPGQTVLYDQIGSRVMLPNDGTVLLYASGETLRHLVTDVFMQLFNAHTHSGVQPGGGQTGVPIQPMTASHLTGATRAGGP